MTDTDTSFFFPLDLRDDVRFIGEGAVGDAFAKGMQVFVRSNEVDANGRVEIQDPYDRHIRMTVPTDELAVARYRPCPRA